jgi:hypothetical protein
MSVWFNFLKLYLSISNFYICQIMVLRIAALCSLAYGYQTCRTCQEPVSQSLTTEAGFNPRLMHVGLVVDKVANNKGFLQVIQFPCIRIISSTVHPSLMLFNLDIFRIIYKHTHAHITSWVARKVTIHNCRSGEGEIE